MFDQILSIVQAQLLIATIFYLMVTAPVLYIRMYARPAHATKNKKQ